MRETTQLRLDVRTRIRELRHRLAGMGVPIGPELTWRIDLECPWNPGTWERQVWQDERRRLVGRR